MRRRAMIKRLWLAAVFAFSLDFSAHTAWAREALPQERDVTWLVYLNANNDLNRYIADQFDNFRHALGSMEHTTPGSSARINLVVQVGETGKPTQRIEFIKSGPGFYDVSTNVLETGEATDMGNRHELVRFVDWGVLNFPAKRYILTIWGHGAGLNGLSFDFSANSYLSVVDLGAAMSDIKSHLGRKLDYLALMACNMSTLEVASEVADSVDILVGSENELYPVLPTEPALVLMATHPQSDRRELGSALARELYSGAAWDLSQLPTVWQAGAHLSSALLSLLDSNERYQVALALLQVMELPEQYDRNVDVRTILEQLRRVSPTLLPVSLLDAFELAIEQTIFTVGRCPECTSTADGKSLVGATLWSPVLLDEGSPDQFILNLYKGLRFERETRWAQAMAHLLEVKQ